MILRFRRHDTDHTSYRMRIDMLARVCQNIEYRFELLGATEGTHLTYGRVASTDAQTLDIQQNA